MHVKFDNYRVENWDPIGVINYLSNIKIALYWHQKGTKRTYDLTDHMMVDLETILAFGSYSCVCVCVCVYMSIYIYIYILQTCMLICYMRGMKKSLTTLLMHARVLHYTYDGG